MPSSRTHTGYPARLAPAGATAIGWRSWPSHPADRIRAARACLLRGDDADGAAGTLDRSALDGRFNYREPTQIGASRSSASKSPAPARSYGLVARLDAEGAAVESLHSRVDGRIHGVTTVLPVVDRVIAVSKGRNCLVELPRRARGAKGRPRWPKNRQRRCFRSSTAARSMAGCTPSRV